MGRNGDDWDGQVHGTQVWEQEPFYSPVLGPNGQPLEYVKHPIGFDLRPVKPTVKMDRPRHATGD